MYACAYEVAARFNSLQYSSEVTARMTRQLERKRNRGELNRDIGTLHKFRDCPAKIGAVHWDVATGATLSPWGLEVGTPLVTGCNGVSVANGLFL